MTRILVFVAVAIGLLAGIHAYLWARMIRDPQLATPWNAIGTAVLVLLGISLPAVLILGRGHPAFRHLLGWPAYLWMGTMFLLFVALLFSDLLRLAATLVRTAAGADALHADRRTLLARVNAATDALVVAGLASVAVRSACGAVAVLRIRIRLDKLPFEQNGLRLVQITDVHVGTTIGKAFIEQIVRQTNALTPDLIAITGDLVDGPVDELRDAIAPLANLRARHGVFFVTGNHEYFSDPVGWLNELPRLGIRVLRNERVTIGTAEANFDLAGVDDRSASHYGGPDTVQALAQALAGRDRARELVLLAHQPIMWLDAEPYGVGLQISGHTHGGQIWPFGYLVGLQQRFIAGHHRRGSSQLYVSRGTGYWGPPMRLRAPAEITEITLESGRAA